MHRNFYDNEKDSLRDKFKDECGVVGIYGNENAYLNTIFALYSLQHRGQESCGIISWDGEKLHSVREHGVVGEVFAIKDSVNSNILPGSSAIGHVRYSTAGGGGRENIQPFSIETAKGEISIAHNGNLTNNVALHNELLQKGYSFKSTSDTEVIIQLIAASQLESVVDRIKESLKTVTGAYSLVFMVDGKLIGARDPAGIRPLSIGKLEGGGYIIASETCAIDILGGEYIRDIKPGEMVVVDDKGIESIVFAEPDSANDRFCIFEYIYFMRPNSTFNNISVSSVREAIGKELAKESPVDSADVVVPIPDSGVHAAIGFAEESNIAYKQGILRGHFVGRTFISPTQIGRDFKAKLKYSIDRGVVEGKKVVLVDDSIVRGTTMPKIIDMVRKADAKEVHVRISSPPIKYPCFYGIDTPLRKDLEAAYSTPEDTCKKFNADSLAYVSVEGLYKAVGCKQGRCGEKREYCDACFTGDYSIPLTDREEKRERLGTDDFV